MKNELTFATKENAKELLAIYAPYVEHSTVTFEYDVPSVEEFSRRIELISKTFPYLVYKVDGNVVGYAYASTFQSRAAFMWDVETSIYLKEEFHGKDIASKLYDALFALLIEQGFYNCYAQITYPNPKSMRFHNKYEFKPVGLYENCGFKLNSWCSLAVLLKQLNKPTNSVAPKPYIPIHELDPAFVSSVLQV